MVPIRRGDLWGFLGHVEFSLAAAFERFHAPSKGVPRCMGGPAALVYSLQGGQVIRRGHAGGEVEIFKFSEPRCARLA